MMNNRCIIGVGIAVGISFLGVIALIVLFFLDTPKDIVISISTWVGILGTVASVALSVVAMIYSNKSSSVAEESLKKVNAHYKALCDEIKEKHIKDNLGRQSILNILDEN